MNLEIVKRSARASQLLVRMTIALLLAGACAGAQASDNFGAWFESFKKDATDAELYRFLYQMPKGGDLHNHISGSGYVEWWYELALAQEARGYEYYTKVRINNCEPYARNEFGPAPYLMLFRNVLAANYEKLSACEKTEYKPLKDLNEDEKTAWLNSIRLDKAHEGRDEFFQTHWQRLNDIYSNPYILAELIYLNMREFGEEGLIYFEPQVGTGGFLKPDGSGFSSEEVAQIYRNRLAQADVAKTGVTVRFQRSILRFLPSAEQDLERMYRFVHENNDLWVAVNMVGREDNDKGYPLRFLSTLRELRKEYSGVKLSIHAGEVDEPNQHVRDTLLLGADRIGHGINLISDPDTMLLMRHGPYLIEINLISNLLLEYVSDYQQHPFPEYLRTGIPVALSTDDRGMWDSTMTDEFFVAVTEFDLSWEELQLLHTNSLSYAFVDDELKRTLLASHKKRTERFMKSVSKSGPVAADEVPSPRGFICQRYELCTLQ